MKECLLKPNCIGEGGRGREGERKRGGGGERVKRLEPRKNRSTLKKASSTLSKDSLLTFHFLNI